MSLICTYLYTLAYTHTQAEFYLHCYHYSNTSALKFLTWNIRGVESQVKKNKILNHLTQLQPDICLLQETHLAKSEDNKLLTSQFNHIFSANYNTKQRGVSVLINKTITFTHNTTVTHPDGRFIIINISINNNPITIVSIYGPDSPSFFHNFFSSISMNSNCSAVTRGDFNTVIIPSMDKRPHLDFHNQPTQ